MTDLSFLDRFTAPEFATFEVTDPQTGEIGISWRFRMARSFGEVKQRERHARDFAESLRDPGRWPDELKPLVGPHIDEESGRLLYVLHCTSDPQIPLEDCVKLLAAPYFLQVFERWYDAQKFAGSADVALDAAAAQEKNDSSETPPI